MFIFRFIKFIFGLIIFALIIGFFALAYFGFAPGVSKIFGSDKPKDLGIKFTQDDLKQANAKVGIIFSDLSQTALPLDSIKFTGKNTINNSFTSAEITALANNTNWKYNFIPDSQIKFNQDGTVEASGHIYIDKLYGYLQSYKIDSKDLKPYLDKIILLSSSPAYYVKLAPSITNNQVTLNLQQSAIGRASFLTKIIQDNNPAIAQFIQNSIIAATPNAYVKSLKIENSVMHFEGTFPSNIAISRQ